MTLLSALPAQGAEACTFEFEVAPEALATTTFVLGITPEGACIAQLGGTADIAPIGPVNPARADGCATVAPALSSCAGLTSHTGAPILAMSGYATALGGAGFASVSMNWNTGTSTTFRCFWNGAQGGLYGAFVVGGGCGFITFGSGASWTLGGFQGAGNAGALAHLTA